MSDYTRVLGLDVGTKRIGVSMSDLLLITAQPLKMIPREPEKEAFLEIEKIVKENNVQTVVVGLPKNMNGTIGTQAEDCQNFGAKLKELLNINIVFEDERLTSKQAEFTLKEQGKKYTKDKKMVDIVSAQLILQQYLDKRR